MFAFMAAVPHSSAMLSNTSLSCIYAVNTIFLYYSFNKREVTDFEMVDIKLQFNYILIEMTKSLT